MTVDQLISDTVPTLSLQDSGDRALVLMEENASTQIPVVSDDHYVALAQENDIYNWEDPTAELSTAHFLNYKPAVLGAVHPFEAIRIMNQMNLSILPVIDNEQKYLGSVTKETLLKYIAENSGIDKPGGIIVLEVAPRNYTLFEIARICENEDVMILNLAVHTNDQGMLEVTLKLNRSAIDGVVSSFERHGYHVREMFGEEANNEDIEGKYNLLMNYINM